MNARKMVKVIECPRDAMQGVVGFIPTAQKVQYINQLLKVGFDTIDFGSFVSPKAIPQMRDTAEVLDQLELDTSRSKLLAIVANVKGAEIASAHSQISYQGFPLSASETFQQRNTNKSIAEALEQLARIQEICHRSGQTLVAYISMGFGNPYGDLYDPDAVAELTYKLDRLSVKVVSPSDTVGMAEPEGITTLFKRLIPEFPHIEFGAHLHTVPLSATAKIEAAYLAGCRRFDGALRGYGGCPMATDELTGNMPTEQLVDFLKGEEGEPIDIDDVEFDKALFMANDVFPA